MPDPKPKEPRNKFISRCMPIVLAEAGTKSTAHAVAKCGGIWDQAHKKGARNVTGNLVVSRVGALRRRRSAVLSGGSQVSNQARVGNPLRADPTRTATLRRVFMEDLNRRFARLKRKIRQLVVVEDAFGLRFARPVIMAEGGTDGAALITHTRWAFHTDPQKVEAFQGWLKTQVDTEILAAQQAVEQKYWQAYVEQGYRKGAGRAFDDTNKARRAVAGTSEQLAFYEGSKEQFLASAFAQPVAIDKVKLLAGRVFTELKGVTEGMSAKITRNLTDGLVQGMNPREIARRMIKDGIGTKVRGVQSKALTIARTEIIRAHAEGQLDAMEQMGVTKVGVMVEWSTAGDDRVCPLCEELNGVVLDIKEAKGIIPRHPNCRCAHIPANVGESTKGQIRGKAKVEKAMDDSIRAEMPKIKKRTLAEQKNRTSWAGADKTIAKRRPRSILEPKPTPRKPKKVAPTKVTPRRIEPKPTVPKPVSIVRKKEWKDLPKWQQESLEKQAAKLTPDERMVIADYQESGIFDPMNNYLRTGRLAPTEGMADFAKETGLFDFSSEEALPWLKSQIADMDKVLAKSIVKSDLVVYRGIDRQALRAIKKGQILKDKGFVSTSLDQKVAEEFAQEGGTVLKIKVPHGSRGLYADPIVNLEQRELILARNSEFKVTAIRKEEGREVIYATLQK